MTGTDDDHDHDHDHDTEDGDEEAATGNTTDDAGASTGGIGSLLRGLIETIAETDPGSETVGRGRLDIGRASIGHDFSIGVGTLDDVTDADRRRVRGFDVDAGIDARPGSGTTDTADTIPGTDAEHPTSVRYNADESEAIVATDCPEIDPERLSAGISSQNGDLLVGTDDTIVERVSHRLTDATITAASYHNGVLELHLREESDGTDSDGTDSGGTDATDGERS